MEDRQELLRKDLEKQRDTLVLEINNLEVQLKNKRDYLMKLIGGLEAIQLLYGPSPSELEPEPEPEQSVEENSDSE
jgi:hypothetical protein